MSDALPLPRKTTPKERQRAFRLLFLCLMCTGMGQSIIFTLLPPLSRKLGLTEGATGGIFLASGLIWVFASPWWGRKSDIWGRKPVILAGLLGYAISMSLFAGALLTGVTGLMHGLALFAALMGARSIYGLLSSGTFPAAQAYIADRTSAEERTSGVSALSAAFGLGATLGPGLGAGLAGLVAAAPRFADAGLALIGLPDMVPAAWFEGMVEFSLVAPLFAVGLLALVSFGLILSFLPERTPPQSSMTRGRLRMTDARIIPHVIVGVALSVVQGIQAQTVNFYIMDTLHLPIDAAVSMVGVALTSSAFAAFATQLIIVQQFNLSIPDLLRWGGVLSVIGLALFLATADYAAIVLGLILASIGQAMVRPGNASAASLAVSPEEQGAVAGVTGATAAMGFVIGPMISLPIYRTYHAFPFSLCLGLTALILIFCWLHPAMAKTGPAITPPVDRDRPSLPHH